MTQKSTYPRWVGVLLTLLVPGAAHYFSGRKGTGIKWYVSILVLYLGTLTLLSTPSKIAIIFGFLSIGMGLFLQLLMLIHSYRPICHPGFRGWTIYLLFIFIGAIIPEPVELFKVPTGSMQPTLNGITVNREVKTTSFMDRLIAGKKKIEIHATATGRIENIRRNSNGFVFSIGGVEHNLPSYALETFKQSVHVTQGDVLWAGTVYRGDHIGVQKTSYWFKEPRRGDVIVFKTNGIEHQMVRRDTIYIKRIIGIPGDLIRINPPHIIINEQPLMEPFVFRKFNYSNAGTLESPTNSVLLAKGEYFVLGDNTAPRMSLDSRHFGAIPRESIIGKVRTIYWPFNRIGAVE